MTEINDKLHSKVKSVFILIGIGLCLITIAFIANRWFAKQTIRTIKITGYNILSKGEINNIIDKQIMNVENEGLNLTNIKNTLISNEYIQNVDIWINSKGVLGINLVERVPIAIIINSDAKPNFTDIYGNVFSYNLNKDFINLPVFRNIEISKNIIKNKDFINIVSMLQYNYPLLYARVSEIKYNKNTNEYILLLNLGDINVNIGNINDLENKLNRLYVFINEVVLNSDNIRNYKRLDARWKDKIIVVN